jgi:hypothetical protein
LEKLQQYISPLDFDDYYSVIYHDATEEGYDEGWQAGFEAVTSQFGPRDEG